jgi:hypothetical protein
VLVANRLAAPPSGTVEFGDQFCAVNRPEFIYPVDVTGQTKDEAGTTGPACRFDRGKESVWGKSIERHEGDRSLIF